MMAWVRFDLALTENLRELLRTVVGLRYRHLAISDSCDCNGEWRIPHARWLRSGNACGGADVLEVIHKPASHVRVKGTSPLERLLWHAVS